MVAPGHQHWQHNRISLINFIALVNIFNSTVPMNFYACFTYCMFMLWSWEGGTHSGNMTTCNYWQISVYAI